METMISVLVSPYDFPVAFSAPIGHINNNIPLVIGSKITLSVTEKETSLL
jgi:muramoyltetrapeptide carboxypeptidase